MSQDSSEASVVSIHQQRRWFYVLWSLLLATSLVLLVLWTIPGSTGQGTLTLQITIKNVPPGTRIQSWVGPREKWIGRSWGGDGACSDQILQSTGPLVIGPLKIPIAYRRCLKTYIPGRTSDLVIFKATPPQGDPKYGVYTLSEDLNTGAFRPRIKMVCTLDMNWSTLRRDPKLR